jgi:hypothetical protein
VESFDNRKNASEKKFLLEAEQEFKADARRNKLLALWVAELLGKSDDEAKAYVGEVIVADMEEAGDDDVFRKVRADIDAAGVELSDVALRDKMNAFLEDAREQIFNEG